MARKNLLVDLTNEKLPAGNLERSDAQDIGSRTFVPPLANLGAGRAIGAVSRSIEQIRSQAVSELDAALIDPSPIVDRLSALTETLEELVESIRQHGQQVPILVRPHPMEAGRYQIAYGRRRLRACVQLGRPVRAMIRPLTDQELVVAQGQENSARTDLSFIERALFAARLEDAGYARDTIMAALTVDKTGLSRLISSAVKIPYDLIEAIGPAPKAGRDRWTQLASRLEIPAALSKARAATKILGFTDKPTDERFARIFASASPNRPGRGSRPSAIRAADGKTIATVRENAQTVTVAIAKKQSNGFGAYVAEALPQLYEAFKRDTIDTASVSTRK